MSTLQDALLAAFPELDARLRADFPTLAAERDYVRQCARWLTDGIPAGLSTPGGGLVDVRARLGDPVTTGDTGWGSGVRINAARESDPRIDLLRRLESALRADI